MASSWMLQALFRRATAMSELRDYAGAEVDLWKLIDLEPTSVEGKRLLASGKSAISLYGWELQ
eukprot:3015175-Amphidinium_carterae.1